MFHDIIDKELSEEISKLRKFELQECSNCAVNKETKSEERTSRQDSPAEGTHNKYVLRSAKKRKLMLITEGTANIHDDGEHGHLIDRASLGIQQVHTYYVSFSLLEVCLSSLA